MVIQKEIIMLMLAFYQHVDESMDLTIDHYELLVQQIYDWPVVFTRRLHYLSLYFRDQH